MQAMEAHGAQIDALVSAGRYADAAAAAREHGDPSRAALLYERIWEFGLAAACAREAGEPGRALRHALDARDDALVHDILAELESLGAEGTSTAIDVLARRRRFADAAPLAEKLGDRQRALDLYQKAHLDLDAARLLEETGRDREAGRTLERALAHSDTPEDRARSHLALGLLLARRMQHEEAVRHLQEACRDTTARIPARRALVVELAALGLRDAARDALLAARAHDPTLPVDVDEHVRAWRERVAPARTDRDEDDRSDGGQLVAGRYRLDELIGSGSSGRVYRARDEVSGRVVAAKLFYSVHARDRGAYERFVREARIASALEHPNLVEVHRVAPEHGVLVMELMVGGSLAERLDSHLPGHAVRRVALDVLGGLEAAHQRGVIHRDVKPANIFFDARGTAKLGDFGVAHLLDLGQTQTGGLIGTLAYMAPEQITGAGLTVGADLYGLGVTLFEALTGRLPFLGPDFVAQHLGEAPPPASEVAPDVAPAWDPILARLLAKSPDDRYDALEDVRADLEGLALEGGGPQPLVLPRGKARARPRRESAPPRRSRRESAQPPVAPEEETARYAFERPIRRTSISQLGRAVDTSLDRSVLLERYDEGALDDATERRLLALARGGGPYLQRVLALDREAGVAVFEAPAGLPLDVALADRALEPRRAARLLQRLARAVAPVHDAGSAHGAIDDGTVVLDDGGLPTVLASGLGPAREGATAEDDVLAIVALVARAAGAPETAEALTDALARGIAPEPRAALGDLASVRTGEALYAFAYALEIELLKLSAPSARPVR